MKSYVLVFAHKVPGVIPQRVILVERIKEDWQQGRLNLPGGHIEPGETPQEAASRELKEETTIYCPPQDIKVLGEMGGDGWLVYICFAPFREGHAQPTANDPVHEMHYREALTDPRLIPNLRILIPYCIAQVDGWKLTGEGDDLQWTTNLCVVGGE